jgi:hypothetical protein
MMVFLDYGVVSITTSSGIDHILEELPPQGWSLMMFSVASAYWFVAESDYPGIIRSSQFLRMQMRFAYGALMLVGIVLLGVLNTAFWHIVLAVLLALPLLLAANVARYWWTIGRA